MSSHDIAYEVNKRIPEENGNADDSLPVQLVFYALAVAEI